jgi:hypothetical protein
MDDVPVANQREHEQQKCNQQQAGRFGGVNTVAVRLLSRVVFVSGVLHSNILRPANSARRC